MNATLFSWTSLPSPLNWGGVEAFLVFMFYKYNTDIKVYRGITPYYFTHTRKTFYLQFTLFLNPNLNSNSESVFPFAVLMFFEVISAIKQYIFKKNIYDAPPEPTSKGCMTRVRLHIYDMILCQNIS